jgi:hypothetical protein
VAAADSSFHTTLTLNDGSLMLEDAHTAIANLDPLKRFGSSAFGPVRVRAISSDGTAGDWQPLGTLVRLPGFTTLRCPRAQTKNCILSGSDLFLATSFAATPDFDNPDDVPPQFTGTQFVVPHPVGGILYLKLRDDPATVQKVTLAVTPLPASLTPAAAPAAEAAPAAAQPNQGPPATAPAEAPASQPQAPASQDKPAPDAPAPTDTQKPQLK